MTTHKRIEAVLSGKSSEPILYHCEGCGVTMSFGETVQRMNHFGEGAGLLLHVRILEVWDGHDIKGYCGPVVEAPSSADVQTGDSIETTGWGRTAK